MITREDAEEPISGWTIYDHPKDFPDSLVARAWYASNGDVMPTDMVLVTNDIDELRSRFAREGRIQFSRHPSDDPVIMEVWI